MIAPHRIVDDGRILILDPGPLTFRDLTDTIWHARRTHQRGQHPLRAVFISAQQHYELRPDLRAALEFANPLDQPRGGIGRIWGLDLYEGDPYDILLNRMRLDEPYLHPRDYQFLNEAAMARLEGGELRVTTTPTLNPIFANIARFIRETEWSLGKKIEAAWIDEAKPAVETTHENW